MAIDPSEPRRIVASGERGLLLSRDAGASWRPLSTRLAGMLAWTDRLTVIGLDGSVHQAATEAGSFKRIGTVDGEPAALATHRDELLVALHDNRVLTSSDDGRSWSERLSNDA